jgi:hypothetical protein
MMHGSGQQQKKGKAPGRKLLPDKGDTVRENPVLRQDFLRMCEESTAVDGRRDRDSRFFIEGIIRGNGFLFSVQFAIK